MSESERVSEETDAAIGRALDDALVAAARRVIVECGCRTKHGCEILIPDEYGEIDAGCARFVRAVIGEAP